MTAAPRKNRPVRRRSTTTSPDARWRQWSNLLPKGLAADSVQPVGAISPIGAESLTPNYEFAVDTRAADEAFERIRTAQGPGRAARSARPRKRPRPAHIGRHLDLEA